MREIQTGHKALEATHVIIHTCPRWFSITHFSPPHPTHHPHCALCMAWGTDGCCVFKNWYWYISPENYSPRGSLAHSEVISPPPIPPHPLPIDGEVQMCSGTPLETAN